jgi:hypothetical protein
VQQEEQNWLLAQVVTEEEKKGGVGGGWTRRTQKYFQAGEGVLIIKKLFFEFVDAKTSNAVPQPNLELCIYLFNSVIK